MKRMRILPSLLCLLLQVVSLQAQNYEETLTYLDRAKDNSTIFRSKQALRYNLAFNGTYHWDDDEFQEGGVLLDGKWFDGILLNIDAFGQNVLAKPFQGQLTVTLPREQIDSLVIGGVSFVNLRKRGFDVPEGFYEVSSSQDPVLYHRVDKKLHTETSTFYIYDVFEPTESYLCEKNGGLVKVKKKRARKYLWNPGSTLKISRKALSEAIYPAEDSSITMVIPPLPDSLKQTFQASTLPEGDFKVGDKTIYSSLPAGFFSDGQNSGNDELLRLINAGNEMVTFANKVYEIGVPGEAHGEKAFVRGTVRDVLTGEPLVGIAVYDGKTKAYTMTDAYGTYQVQLPLGENTLGFSGYSLEDLDLNVLVHGDGGLDVVMKEKIMSLKGAVVSAESMVNHRDARMGIEKVRIDAINKVASAFGEADVLKAVLTLPGVKSVGEASSGFNVRGGSTDQNLVLFNDGTIYNPSHLFGIFSAFNTDVINDIELYKSSIPAEFGGRISSVLDVRGREGNSNKVQGSLGLGLLTSRFHMEGPMGKKTTFIVGGRTTYSNWLFNLLPEKSAYAGGNASFSDLNASLTHKINDRNTIQAYGYWSRDKFSFEGDTTFHYSNLNASLKWRSTLSERTNFTLTTGYDQYSNILENTFNEVSGYSVTTGIGQAFIKGGFKTTISDRHTFSYGLQSTLYDLNPGMMDPLSERSLVAVRYLDKQRALESAVYASDNWKPTEKLSFDAGIRYTAFTALNPSKFYGAPEFRISGKYSFLENLSLKAGFNSMNQYIHLISNTASVSPMDAWHLSSEKVKPQKGWQAASGLYWTVADNKVDLSIEAYYKRLSNYLDYKSGAVLIMNENLEDELVGTYGKAYGIEFMAKKPLGKLNGWMSYTYSRSLLREMEDRGISTINGGAWYPAPHDKPHDFKLVGNYKFTHRYSLSFNVDYSTGRPVTIPVSKYQYGGGVRLGYSLRNGYRIPDYFRMDLALNIDPGHYLRKLTHMTWTLGVYNVTGRKNAYSIYYTTHSGTAISGYKVSVFASPIPYININMKFG